MNHRNGVWDCGQTPEKFRQQPIFALGWNLLPCQKDNLNYFWNLPVSLVIEKGNWCLKSIESLPLSDKNVVKNLLMKEKPVLKSLLMENGTGLKDLLLHGGTESKRVIRAWTWWLQSRSLWHDRRSHVLLLIISECVSLDNYRLEQAYTWVVISELGFGYWTHGHRERLLRACGANEDCIHLMTA